MHANQNLHTLLVEMSNDTVTLENAMAISSMINIELPCDPEI